METTMTGVQRRKKILEMLGQSSTPLSGGALGRAVGVSRQVVVQDIALLRTEGHPVLATARGYVLEVPHQTERDDVKEGIIASRIAAHAADIAKGIPGAKEWDRKMAQARARLDWEEQFSLAIDPEKARRYRAESKPEKEDTCSMCGNFCAVKNMNRILSGEIVSIFDE